MIEITVTIKYLISDDSVNSLDVEGDFAMIKEANEELAIAVELVSISDAVQVGQPDPPKIRHEDAIWFHQAGMSVANDDTPNDYNRNAIVKVASFEYWRAEYQWTALLSNPDANGDGVILACSNDLDALTAWVNEYNVERAEKLARTFKK
jgi:hypothetical protein